MPTETPESTDDLSKPLGRKTKRKSRFNVPLPLVGRAIAGLLGLCVAVLAGWILFVNEPYGGEPLAVVSADTRVPEAAKTGEPSAAGKPDAVVPTALAEGEKPGQTVTIIDGTTGKRQEVWRHRRQVQPEDQHQARHQTGCRDRSALSITSRHGAIPKIAPTARGPPISTRPPTRMRRARRDAHRPSMEARHRSKRHQRGAAKLPRKSPMRSRPMGPMWNAGFAARGEGHEVLLQVSMEPFDFPDNDPGPQTLLTSNAAELNVDNLHWFLSRFQGYVGVTTLMGARFTATEQALLPILREVGKRGLIYFDDGASPRRVAGQISGGLNVAFARADRVLDSVPTANEIDMALARLEAVARSKGVAVGSASALPVTIDRIAQWARTAAARGITLVPISAVANRAKPAT